MSSWRARARNVGETNERSEGEVRRRGAHGKMAAIFCIPVNVPCVAGAARRQFQCQSSAGMCLRSQHLVQESRTWNDFAFIWGHGNMPAAILQILIAPSGSHNNSTITTLEFKNTDCYRSWYSVSADLPGNRLVLLVKAIEVTWLPEHVENHSAMLVATRTEEEWFGTLDGIRIWNCKSWQRMYIRGGKRNEGKCCGGSGLWAT